MQIMMEQWRSVITRTKIYKRTGFFQWHWHYFYTKANGEKIGYGTHLASLRRHLKFEGCKDVKCDWQDEA